MFVVPRILARRLDRLRRWFPRICPTACGTQAPSASNHHQAGKAVLLPDVELHPLLPVIGHRVQAVVAAENHQVEDVLLEAAPSEAGPACSNFAPMRLSTAIARAASRPSAPVASQRVPMLLIGLEESSLGGPGKRWR